MLTSLPHGEVLAPADPVRYRSVRHPALRPVVSTFWSTGVPKPVRVVRVLPDAAVDIVVEGGRVRVAGPDTQPSVERLTGGRVLGVQLWPDAVPAVLGVPAAALLNSRVDLVDLWGSAGEELADQVRAARSGLHIVDLIERALLRRIDLQLMVPAVGGLRAHLASGRRLDLRRLGVSERQLRRRCVAAYGYGPRLLTRVMRFQVAVDQLRSRNLSLAQVAVEAGYVDQSHLAHDVGEFSGMTPRGLRASLG